MPPDIYTYRNVRDDSLMRGHDGARVVVSRMLTRDEYDPEVGTMFRVRRLDTGESLAAWAEELELAQRGNDDPGWHGIAAARAARADDLNMREYADEWADYSRHRYVILYVDNSGSPGWRVATFHETMADVHETLAGGFDYVPAVLADLDTGAEWDIDTTARIGRRTAAPAGVPA